MVSRAGRSVSSRAWRRNTQGKNVSNFKLWKSPRATLGRNLTQDPPARTARKKRQKAQLLRRSSEQQSGLIADGREEIAAAADGPDHRGLGRIRLDLAADAHDSQIHGTVEG